MYDTIIIGTGCSGYAAAMYCGRFNMKTLLIGEDHGGLITWTDTVENYPGFKKLTGIELSNKLREHAQEYNIEIKSDYVTKITKSNKGFSVATSKQTFKTKTIIYATGTKVKKLGIPGEDKFNSKGVHFCALCDSYSYKGKDVCLIGGSDSATKDALVLSEVAKKVYIIYRGTQIHPEPINMERVKKKKNIEIINNTNVKEIRGDRFVTHVILDRPYKKSNELKLSGVFIAIGHTSLSDLAKSIGVKTNKNGEICINRRSETNVPGFYAAGDVADTGFKQAITGVAEAVTASYYVFEFIGSSK
ncbi:MAG: FAD-dependent oxidoreductase [Nanoarchaeota archaeon]